MERFDRHVVLVTGGAAGIGRAAAGLFAARGARVAIVDIDALAGEAACGAIRAAGGDALFVRADVAEDADVAAAVERTVDHFGALHCAFNNAGISGPAHLVADMPIAQWRRALDVMLTGPFLCMKHEIPRILAAGGGAIVNCASGAGLIGFPGQSGYVASKHGVIGLTKAAALEYGSQGVRINAVCPGTARTPMLTSVIDDQPEIEQALVQLHPIGRIAEPEEIAEAALWLCGTGASFVSGTALVVDGGYIAR